MSTPPRDIEDLLALYFDDQATPEVCEAIEAWLAQDPANVRILAEYGSIERMVYCEQKKQDASAIYTLLTELEDQAEIVELKKPVSLKIAGHTEHGDPGALSAHDLAAVGGYLLRKAALSKPALIAYAAAVALLAAVLVVPWGDTDPSTVQVRPKPGQVQPLQAVATLTAEHDAAWDRRPGQDLYAGQRFTLTEGFAQITTRRGAVAILQAPCSIELIDSDNALRLHTGRLVGICESDSSEGFLVRTPHMDITDLGTRFGVDVTDSTRVMVVQGKVQVSSTLPATDDRPFQLVAGQVAASDPTTGRLALSNEPINRMMPDWRVLAAAPRIDGDIRYEPTLPTDLSRGGYENNDLTMFPERLDVSLDQPVPVTMARPGTYSAFNAEGPALAKGTRVDSYLIHYDPIVDTDTHRSRRATIQFDRPILGVIANAQSLHISDALFVAAGIDGTRYENPGPPAVRGLEDQRAYPGDIVEISDDRRTLSVVLYAGSGIDQLRVLVQPQTTDQ